MTATVNTIAVPALRPGPMEMGIVEVSPGRCRQIVPAGYEHPSAHPATGWYCPEAPLSREEAIRLLREAAWYHEDPAEAEAWLDDLIAW